MWQKIVESYPYFSNIKETNALATRSKLFLLHNVRLETNEKQATISKAAE